MKADGRIQKNTEPDILIFAGTTEGRELAQYAEKISAGCYVSTATEYGKELLEGLSGVRPVSGRMDEEQIGQFLKDKKIRLVIDATHPFARVATENIRSACAGMGVRYVRCLREQGMDPGKKAEEGPADRQPGGKQMVVVDSVSQAVEYLQGTTGNILISTGSKELHLYTVLDGYRDRCFARVLSTAEAVEESVKLGFQGRHLIAMQGPFSREMNLAVLHQTGAAYFVTKESGKAGGFEEKLAAAEHAGAVLVVIGRPDETGESVERVKEIIRQRCTVQRE